MNRIVLQVIVIGVFFQLGSVFAQRDINYTVSSDRLDAVGEQLQIYSAITKEGATIVWLQQANGKSTPTEFSINKVLGNWNRSKGRGRLMYRLSAEGFDASFILSGNAKGLRGKFVIRKKGEQPYTYSLNLQSITYQ